MIKNKQKQLMYKIDFSNLLKVMYLDKYKELQIFGNFFIFSFNFTIYFPKFSIFLIFYTNPNKIQHFILICNKKYTARPKSLKFL